MRNSRVIDEYTCLVTTRWDVDQGTAQGGGVDPSLWKERFRLRVLGGMRMTIQPYHANGTAKDEPPSTHYVSYDGTNVSDDPMDLFDVVMCPFGDWRG